MTTAYTSLLGLALPVTGELSGTWGTTVNDAITSLLDSAVAGTTTISSDADVTLTTTTGAANTSREAILLWTAGGTVTRNITAPAQSKTYIVINKSSSTQSIVLRGVGPTTGVTIIKGEAAVCAWNGSDFIKVSNISGAGVFSSITNTGLTSGRVVYSTTGGLETDSANLTFSGTTLTLKTGYYESYDPTDSTSAGLGVRFYTDGGGTKTENGRLVVQQNTTGSSASNMLFYTNSGSGLAEKMRLDSSGNLGIGVSSPGYKLDVSGTANINGITTLGRSTNVAVAVDRLSDGLSYGLITFNNAFANATASGIFGRNTGGDAGKIYLTSPNEVNFQIAGVTKATLDASGNVGIGTTSPSYKLDVNGGIIRVTSAIDNDSIIATSATNNTALSLINTATSGSTWKVISTGGTSGYGTGALAFERASSLKMVIDSSGNVGIGTTTTSINDIVSAARPLVVAVSDAGTSVGGATASINIVNTNTTTSNSAQLNFASTYTSSGINTVSGYISTIFGARTNTANYYAAGTLVFGTNTGGVANGPSERMRIDSSGNVGIGTTSPSSYGRLTVNDTAAKSVYVRSSSTNFSGLLLENTNSATKWQIGVEGGAYNTAGLLNIGIDGVGSTMLIDSNGRIQVNGTTVVDSARISVSADGANSTGVSIKALSTSCTLSTYWNTSNTTVGSITTNGTTVAYNTSSDYRLKENIAPMMGALAKVALLKPVTYKWKSNGSDGEGFIAHELAEVCPAAVHGEKDAVDEDGNPKYQGIDVSFLVATLTAAIQEQQALITSLTARIATLESK
jgi:hypothetical protein